MWWSAPAVAPRGFASRLLLPWALTPETPVGLQGEVGVKQESYGGRRESCHSAKTNCQATAVKKPTAADKIAVVIPP